MMNYKYAPILTVIWLLSSCANNSIPDDFSWSGDDVGVVVFSMSYPVTHSEYTLHIREVFLDGIYGNELFEPTSGGGKEYILDSGRSLDKEGVNEEVFAIRLREGKYHVFMWSIYSGNSYVVSRHLFDIPFQVRPGKVTYIGRYNFLATKSSKFGPIKKAEVTLIEYSQRDMPEMQAMYPHLEVDKYYLSIKRNSIIYNLGNGYEFVPVQYFYQFVG